MKNVWFGVAALWLIAAVILVKAAEKPVEAFGDVSYMIVADADTTAVLAINDSTSYYTSYVDVGGFRRLLFSFRYYRPDKGGSTAFDTCRIWPILQHSWDRKKWTDWNAAGAAMDSIIALPADSIRYRTIAQNNLRIDSAAAIGRYVRFKLWVRDTIQGVNHTASVGKKARRGFSAYITDGSY